jgi:hypothetical protein
LGHSDLKIQSVELISRETKVTARTLLILSAALFAIFFYDLNSTPWDFVGREIQPAEFREITTCIIAFVLLSHLIHWVGDYSIYSTWFQTNYVTADNVGAIGSFKNGRQAMKDAFYVRMERVEEDMRALEETLEKTSDVVGASESTDAPAKNIDDAVRASLKEVSEKQDSIERNLGEMEAVANDIAPGFKVVSSVANWIVYGWYLALPVCFSIGAIVFIWASQS